MDKRVISRIEDKILETLLKAQTAFSRSFDVPAHSFDLGGKRVAGRATYNLYSFTINPNFLREHEDTVIERTVPHEIAHLLSVKLYGELGKGHGRYWKFVMRKLGLEPSRCHDMQLSHVQGFAYKCNCNTYNLSPIRHHRAPVFIQAKNMQHHATKPRI